MDLSTTAPAESIARARGLQGNFADNTSSLKSAVSWGAIAAGAAAAASLSLILMILGVGLGLSSVSPWALDGVSATTFGLSTILWLTFTQLLASALGGYLAGRLRTKWTEVHTNEVFFRDTAHGFLSWAVASLATAALLSSVIGSILGGGVQVGASMVGGVANTAGTAAGAAASSGLVQRGDLDPMGYFVDSLFSRDGATTDVAGATGSASSMDIAEVSRIFTSVSRSEPLPQEDIRYVGQIVAQRTGLSQQEAEKRVTDAYARAQAKVGGAQVAAREAADTARTAFATSALWLVVSLLIGAFVASLAATFGGRLRDA